MKAVSLFSGIEAWSVACKELPIETVAVAEIEPAPCKLLAHHYPDVPNLGDVSQIDWSKYVGSVDIIVGGSPCQSFSVAGLRQGLSDPRGSLMLEYLRAVAEVQPKWCVWENVPGVLSTDGGRAFATFLKGLEELGYGIAYRVLDAQFFGVAQRRRRVFVVGCAGGDWRRAAAVLFDSEGLRWNSQTSKEKREELTSSTGKSVAIAGNIIGRKIGNGGNGVGAQEELSYTLTSTDVHGCFCMATTHTNTAIDTDMTGTLTHHAHKDAPVVYQDTVGSLCARDYKGVGNQYVDEGKVIVAAPSFSKLHGQQLPTNEDNLSYALATGQPPNFCKKQTVRRLTPLECERLQGFPDQYTNVENLSDSARYKALGNSMAVPVMKWIGEGILLVEDTNAV